MKSEIEEMLGMELLALIIPEPDQCFLAGKTGVPVLSQDRDTQLETQLRTLAQRLLQ